MKTFSFILFISLFLIGIVRNSLAQSEKLRFEHLTIEQGLSHNFVVGIMQDRKGFLWFGNGNGLDKYDGYRFRNYKFNPRDTTSLTKNQVNTLWEDKEGIIWIGTSEGICKFDPRTEKFTRLEKSSSNPYAFNFAQSFNEDAEGNLWVSGSFEGELRLVDKKTGIFSTTNYADMLRPTSASSLKASQRLHIIYKDKKGMLWIGSPSGLHRLHLTPQGSGKASKISFTHFRHIPDDTNSISPNGVSGIYEDHKGIFWITTYAGILNAFDPQTGKFTHYQPGTDKLFSFYSLLENKISEDLEGNLWIGTTNGLYKLDPNRKVITPFQHNPTEPASINSSFIWSLLVDKSGIIWATTPEGINKLDPHQKPFTLYQYNPLNAASLSHNKVASICEDKEGVVWVGTMGGGLNALNKNTGEFTHYRYNNKDKNSLRSDTVSAILEDSEGNLWIGNGEILSVFNQDKQNFTHYTLNHPFLPSNGGLSIFTIYEDRQKIFWLGTNNGILSFDRQTGKTKHYPYNPDNPAGISDYWALAIREDSKGNLWIGPGSQALNKLNRKTGKFTHYKHDRQKPGSIASNTIPSVYEDSKGNLWFGTGEGGLCQFNQTKETFTTYTDKDGLAGNAVFSILEDNPGDLWLGTNNGLSRFSPSTRTFTNYDVADGLQSKLFTYLYTAGTAFKGKDGILYFGGNNGFNAFNPANIHSNTYIPPVVITQFKLFDKVIPGKQEMEEIELNYDQNFFSLEFAALNYTSSQKNQYAYQLKGVDKNWVFPGSRRMASYTEIPPGDYTFQVKGSNNDGIWNEKGTLIRIIIHPPWWRTWWAYTFYGLCLLVAGFALDRYRRKRLIQREGEKVRERELEQARKIKKAYHKLKQTQSQLVQKEKMASLGELTAGIAHEIQNPLNFVNNFSEVNKELIAELKEELAKGNTEEVNVLVANLEENEQKISHHGQRADSIVKNMLQHSRAGTGQKQPTDINALAEEYLRLAYYGLRAKDKDFNANLITGFDKSIGKVEVVPQDLGRVLLNLFNNAFYAIQQKKSQLNAQYQPEVKVTTCLQDKQVEIKVWDNGSGIPENIKSKIFQPFFTTKPTGQGTGLGLSLSYDIITKGHQGELRVESQVDQFAEFVIHLPI